MSSATIGPDAPHSDVNEVEAARRLADALDNGDWLRPIAVEDAPLDPGEEAYADLLAHGWRYHAIDVPYEHRTVMFGGPLLFAATALASCVANHRRRREAERLAAPQWRPLGPLRVVVASRRLLVLHQDAWWSVWYGSITGVRSWPDLQMLDLAFVSDPAYRLAGPAMGALARALEAQAASAQLTHDPAHPR